MNKLLLISLSLAISVLCSGQQVEQPIAPATGLGHAMEPFEIANIEAYRNSRGAAPTGITTPPGGSIRTMAEWEEVDKLVLSWTSYPPILKEIVRHAKNEVEVIIYTNSVSTVSSYLLGSSAGGPLPDLNNVTILVGDFNSIWIRDYGAESVYRNDVDSLFLLDWIYNRPRPDDDAQASLVSAYTGLDLYSTTQAPYDLVHTGGNFMSDGFGTAFSSDLVLDENAPGAQFNITGKGEAMVDTIMNLFMGIKHGRYIKMDKLPFDGIHHIDMHMKLLDEETLLVGEFPTGLSDGPQLEANLQYVLSNFNSVFGTPYDLYRIPMPTSTSGAYPPSAYYRTFTNSIFLNKTILVPTYRPQFDTTAMRIYNELLPGYNVVPIDCDNSGANIIAASGALHCITKTIGVQDPLLISHQPLDDTSDDQNPYQVDAFIKHKSGIASAQLFWTTDTATGYNAVAMSSIGNDDWQGFIPAQPSGSTVFYYVHATANSGKEQVRPIVAPDGYWKFKVDLATSVTDLHDTGLMGEIFPNPASAITAIPISLSQTKDFQLSIYDAMGRHVQSIFSGEASAGEQYFFIDARTLVPGTYSVVATTNDSRQVSRLVVR